MATSTLTAIENKISDHTICITNPEFNRSAAEKFPARLAQAYLASKKEITNFVKNTDFDHKLNNLNKKVASNKTKHALAENELNKLQIFNSILFIGVSYFNDDGAQRHLILYFKKTRWYWKSCIMDMWRLVSRKIHYSLLLIIIVFLHQLNSSKIQIFVLIFKGSCFKSLLLQIQYIFYCFWIRHMVRRFKFWFYFKGLSFWSCWVS